MQSRSVAQFAVEIKTGGTGVEHWGVAECMQYLGGTVQRQGVNVEVSLDGVHSVELDVEEEEDKSVQSWTQTITQASDPCYHPLDHTCRDRRQVTLLLRLLKTCYC